MPGSDRRRKPTALTHQEFRREVSAILREIVVVGMRLVQQYRELDEAAYGASGREKVRIHPGGKHADPTLEILEAKRAQQEALGSFVPRLRGVARSLQAISHDMATALMSEQSRPEYPELQDVTPAERDRIHREREAALRSA